MGRWTIVMLGCSVAAIFFASLMYLLIDSLGGVPPKPYELIVWWLARFYLWAALSPLTVRLVRYFPLQPPRASHLIIHFGASLLFSSIHIVLHFSIMFLLTGNALLSCSTPSTAGQFLSNYPFGVAAYWVIVAIVYATDYYVRFGQEQLRSTKLQAQLAEAHFRALQMQLQPHFLFNALHSLSDLVSEEPLAATTMIARLGDFLRLTLHASNLQWVPLSQELEFLHAYLDIERIRFADRLRISEDVDIDVLDAAVPNLLLQPLVENAVRHGFSSHLRPGLIEIAAERRGEALNIEIRDNGPGVQEDPNYIPDGIGLKNTKERLKQAYGFTYSLDLLNRPEGGTVVRCTFPFRRFNAEQQTAPVEVEGTAG